MLVSARDAFGNFYQTLKDVLEVFEFQNFQPVKFEIHIQLINASTKFPVSQRNFSCFKLSSN
jgi:hypothetical protein